MKAGQGGRHRRWVRRLLIAAVATPTIVAVLGFWVVPPIVKRVAEKQLGALLGRRVTVGSVRANPFSLSLTVENFQIFDADGTTPFVGFARLYVNAQLSSMYRRAPIVREVRLESPRVRVARLKATGGAWADTTAYNFSDILARMTTGSNRPPPPASDAPARFSLNNIRITDGDFVFEDRPLGVVHKISGFDLGVPFVSTLPTFVDTFVEPGLRLTIDGTPFAIVGRSKPFKDSLETTIELRADDFDLTKYLPYVPMALRFDVASALLDVNVDVSFVRTSTDAPRLTARGRVALEKVALREAPRTDPADSSVGAPLLGWRQFEVLIGSADIMAQRFKIDRVTLAGLDIHARRAANGSWNLERLVPESAGRVPEKSPPPPRRAPHQEPRFEIGEFVLKDAVLHARDDAVRPPFMMTVDQVAVSARGVSNTPGARATLTAGLRANPGGTLKQEGTLTLTPLVATGSVTLDGVEPAHFAPYYDEQIAFDVRQGRLRLGGSYRYAQPGKGLTPEIQFKNAFVELAELALRRRGARDDFFAMREFSVHDVDVDPGRRTAVVGTIHTRDGRLRAERDEAGTIDLTRLMAPSLPSPSSVTPVPPADAAPRARTINDGPWTVSLGRLEMEGWSARFEDRMVKPRAVLTIAPIAIKAEKLGTAPGTRGTVDVRLGINKLGHLAVTGSASLEPTAADLRIDLRGLEILPLQPYFSEQVNLVVTDGALSVKGQAKVDMPKPPGGTRAGQGAGPPPVGPKVNFAGDIDITSFASVDGSKHEEFLKWKSLHFGRLTVSNAPLALGVRDIALTDFYSRLMIFPDAHFNVQDILSKPGATEDAKSTAGGTTKVATKVATTKAETTKAAKNTAKGAPEDAVSAPAATPAPQITIGQVTLQGGHVSFSDQLIRPHYAAELTELAGRVSGLSADGATQADVDIRGSVDHSGNLSIVGKANPLAKNLFVDVKVELKDFELPPTSPYAAKYAGYGIEKGKLALALDYHIADKKLDAKNRLIVEQFTFGDKVPSPDATGLPVRLAVALLKDRHGVIDIDLPIAGSLDNPDFKIGRAVLKVLGNLIVKAVTAPFSMIASLFGGGEELSRLDFPQGLATLDARARSKLASLAKALRERPGLSFEIEGGADRDLDRESLKRSLYEQKLRTQKMLEVVATGAAVASPDDARFDPSERARLVDKAYKAETFPKPRNVLGRPKDLPADEMEKLMLANTIVDDDALRLLAERRGTVVREAIAKITPDGATRLFLVAPHLAPKGAAAAKTPGNRVEFRLKKN